MNKTYNRRSFIGGTSLALTLAAFTAVPTIGCNTSWITTAEQDIPTIKTILDSVLAIAADATGNAVLSPAAQSILNLAISTAQGALVTLQALITDYQASPSATVIAKITAALEDVQTNLSGILSTAQIKDSALIASISAGLSLAISVVSTISLLIPSSPASLRLKASGAKTVAPVLPTPAQLKLQFNQVISAQGYGQFAVA